MNSLMIGLRVYRGLAKRVLVQPSAAYASKTKIPDDEIIKGDDEETDLSKTLIKEEEDPVARAAYIANIRNVSRLQPHHRRIVKGLPPDLTTLPFRPTLSYLRKLYGRHGEASGVDVRVLFETPAERADREEYERVAHPHTVPEMIAIHKKEVAEKAANVKQREENIARNLAKLDKWKEDLQKRLAKKEADVRLAKEKRERMVEEIRRQFGFRIDPRSPKFQELLEQKKKEDAKASKKLKKEKQKAYLLEKIKRSDLAVEEQQKGPAAVDANAEAAGKAETKAAKPKAKQGKKDKSDSGSDSDSDTDEKNDK